jgi:hypothetical protein
MKAVGGMKKPPKNVFEAIRGTQKDIGNRGGFCAK